MSYDIYLLEPVTRKIIVFSEPHFMRGGTYALGGTTAAHLNITYNYWPFFESLGEKGIREIYGMTAADSIPRLNNTIRKLGDDVDDDYWKPTEGNAKQALLQLVALAKMRPDGVWNGD